MVKNDTQACNNDQIENPSPQTLSEKRKYERFDLKLFSKIKYRTNQNTQMEKEIDLHTENVCQGGAYFITSVALKKGTRVDVRLILDMKRLKKTTPNRSYIDVDGFVLRSESNGMAICFDKGYALKSV